MAGDVPTIIGDLFLSGILFFLFLPLPKASFILRTKVRLSQGFNKKSVASFFKAFTASSTSPYAVSMTTGSAGAISRIRFSQYNPSLPLLIPAEKFISRIITSIGEVFMIDMIWFGWWAVFISLNSVSSNNSSEANTPLLSSTIKIVPFSISFLLSEAKGICFWLFLQMRRPIIGRFLLFSVMLLFTVGAVWHLECVFSPFYPCFNISLGSPWLCGVYNLDVIPSKIWTANLYFIL